MVPLFRMVPTLAPEFDEDGAGARGRRSAAGGLYGPGHVEGRHRCSSAEIQRGRIRRGRARADAAGDGHAAVDGHGMAETADLKPCPGNAGIHSVAVDRALGDKPVARRCKKAHRRIRRRRPDQHRRSGAVGRDRGGALAGVGNAVAILVGIGRAVVGGSGIEDDAVGDVAGNHHCGAALEQVVGVELRRIGGSRRRPVAGRADHVLDRHRAADIAGKVDPDRIAALDGNRAVDQADVAGHGRGPDGGAVVADDRDGAGAHGQRSGEHAVDRDAGRLVALDGDAAAGQDIPRERPAAEHVDAEAVRPLRERTIDVAVLVGVGRRIILVDGDRAGVGDGAGKVGVGEDARRIVGSSYPDGAGVRDTVAAVDGDGRAARRLH